MNIETFSLHSRKCFAFASESPACLLIHPINEQETCTLEQELAFLSATPCPPFLYAAFQINDWNRELSPWEAPPVFRNAPFGQGASTTLDFILKQLLPYLRQHPLISEDVPVIIGGYSLAGLFALWAACNTDAFKAIAAASPSVWFPGWLDYARKNRLQADAIYLSLGDKEAKTKNPIISIVDRCIIEQYQILQEIPSVSSTLEWNQGNHFKEPELRTAKAFRWCMNQMVNQAIQKHVHPYTTKITDSLFNN